MFRCFPHLPKVSIWWLMLLLIMSGTVFPQSSRLTEPERALYRGDYVRAEQLAARQLQKTPADVHTRVILARADLAQGKFLTAFQELRRALMAEPRNIDALYYLSFAAQAMSQQEYQRLFAADPESSRVHQLLAEAALEAQDPTQAEGEFQKALKANPHSAEVATELAELKRSQSKFDEAITFYTKAAEIGPLNYDVAYGLGACYTYKQEYTLAAQWLRKAVAFDPNSAAGHFALGNALFQDGQFDAAIPELKTSLRFEPQMKQAYFLLGRAYTKLGRKDEAAAAFHKVDELSRSTVPGNTDNVPHSGNTKQETRPKP